MWGRSVQCDSGGRETGAAGNEQGAVGAGHADHAPGAGCGWSEGRGAAEGGGGGETPGRGCVGGVRCFLHWESAGRNRRSAPAGWNHRAYPSNLTEGEIQLSWLRTTEEQKSKKNQQRDIFPLYLHLLVSMVYGLSHSQKFTF